MMKLADLTTVQRLRLDLAEAKKTLDAFENASGDNFPAYARTPEVDYKPIREVALLPVPRDVVLSVARREVEKVVKRLAELGVDASEE